MSTASITIPDPENRQTKEYLYNYKIEVMSNFDTLRKLFQWEVIDLFEEKFQEALPADYLVYPESFGALKSSDLLPKLNFSRQIGKDVVIELGEVRGEVLRCIHYLAWDVIRKVLFSTATANSTLQETGTCTLQTLSFIQSD